MFTLRHTCLSVSFTTLTIVHFISNFMTATLTPLQQQYIDTCCDGNIDNMIADINKLSDKFMQSTIDFANWYDAKPEEIQSLIDEIAERTSYIIDEQDYDNFIETLSDYGITTAEQFEDAFYGEFDGYGQRVLIEFTENLVDDLGYLDQVPDILKNAIDYELVYYQTIQHDFVDFQFNENTYIFNRNF